METRTEHQMRDAITDLVDELGSQVAVADQLRLCPSHLNDILHGRRGISDRVAERLGWRKVSVFVRGEDPGGQI